MRLALPLIGVLLILAATQDLFHTLFHPSESGNISDFLTLRIWSAFRRYLPGSIRMAGPFSFMAVIVYCGSSVVIGFTLIYFPFLRQEFISAAASGMTVSNSFW